MNANITFNSIAFNKSYDDKSGSVRQSSARGINNPDRLTIETHEYTDSKTKVKGKRFIARLDCSYTGSDTVVVPITMYTVIGIPSTVPSASIDTVLATYKAMVADAGFLPAVMNDER